MGGGNPSDDDKTPIRIALCGVEQRGQVSIPVHIAQVAEHRTAQPGNGRIRRRIRVAPSGVQAVIDPVGQQKCIGVTRGHMLQQIGRRSKDQVRIIGQRALHPLRVSIPGPVTIIDQALVGNPLRNAGHHRCGAPEQRAAHPRLFQAALNGLEHLFPAPALHWSGAVLQKEERRDPIDPDPRMGFPDLLPAAVEQASGQVGRHRQLKIGYFHVVEQTHQMLGPLWVRAPLALGKTDDLSHGFHPLQKAHPEIEWKLSHPGGHTLC